VRAKLACLYTTPTRVRAAGLVSEEDGRDLQQYSRPSLGNQSN